MMTPSQPKLAQLSVLWKQVVGLAAVQGAIALTWVVYNLYLPKLLGQFGLPQSLAVSLLVGESLLAVGLEPLMGSVSDQQRQWMGSRLPLITFGVILATALFLAIPAVVLWGSPMAAGRWVLLGVIVAWAIAMSLFRSPVLALLGHYAVGTKLPQAASILTLAGALVGAVSVFANQLILSLGPAIAFAIGSLVLLGATAVLRTLNARSETLLEPVLSPAGRFLQPSVIAMLGLILGAGFGVGLGATLMRKVLTLLSPQLNPGLLISLFAAAHVLTVLPAGQLAGRLGNHRAMLLGVGAMAGLLSLVVAVPGSATIASVLLGSAFSLVSNGSIPLALSLVPPTTAGLSVGTYFAGAALASSLSGLAASQLGALSSGASGLFAALALSGAGACITLSDRLQRRQKVAQV
ncbi:MAG: MFS transporter [Leptolyngbya sp. BL-A-14]